jgi:hypothetical protein
MNGRTTVNYELIAVCFKLDSTIRSENTKSVDMFIICSYKNIMCLSRMLEVAVAETVSSDLPKG